MVRAAADRLHPKHLDHKELHKSGVQFAFPHRRLLLETAFMSGLRANELRNLKPNHIDLERGGLILEAEWTKNRKDGLQPLPDDLLRRL